MMRRRVFSHRSHRAAMTLVELLLAVAGIAIIGAALTAMLVATTYATTDRLDVRAVVVKQKVLAARITAAIRGSRMVLAQGSEYLVLWMEDIDKPRVGHNDVLIKVNRTAICGTDIYIFKWDDWAQATIPVPMAVGHEFSGEIVDGTVWGRGSDDCKSLTTSGTMALFLLKRTSPLESSSCLVRSRSMFSSSVARAASSSLPIRSSLRPRSQPR